MERIEVDLHARGNAAVLRLPPRRFPGLLLQGDSLSVLREDVELIRSALRAGDQAAAREWADHLGAELDGLLGHYIAVLDRAGITLPFRRPSPPPGPAATPPPGRAGDGV
ncbi:hypothetical protein [Micromonospora sp. NPDC050200]|uniref:DUF6959 family protein n=1 Tax=Micromonospora sp. NPDC050200 TaxID=3155664 RepID=UPI003404864C